MKIGDVNGVMKNLLDRLAFICHRPEFAGKCAYFLATTGGSPTSHAIRTMQTTITWGFHVVGAIGFKMGALMPDDELNTRYGSKAPKVADRLFSAIQSSAFMRPSFLSLMNFRFQQSAWAQEPPDTLDYQYWSSHGWLDNGCTFYIRHRADFLKVGIARGVGTLLGKVFA